VKAASDVISLPDEAALSWYFGQGLSIYERSTFGAILAKLDRAGFGSETCKRCDGAGILEVGGVNVETKCKTCGGDGRVGRRWCHDCDGMGRVAPYEVQVDAGGWCPGCNGTGSTPMETLARRRTPCHACRAPLLMHPRAKARPISRTCSNCLGTSFEPITVQPIQKDSEEAGVQADDTALTRFAITSRRVERVRASSPALAVALSVYYGDVGQRWALTDKGRIFSLYHMTGPGKKLAKWGEKAAGKAAELGLTAQERIGAQAVIEASQPRQERRVLLDAAGEQARALYARTARAWNRQASAKRDRDDWQRLIVTLARFGHDDLAVAIGRAKLGTVRVG
jgi:hypothetical protein